MSLTTKFTESVWRSIITGRLADMSSRGRRERALRANRIRQEINERPVLGKLPRVNARR